MIRVGSLFAGIGGFELGIERAIPNAHTIWQVEQNTYCQSILRKHWPNATIYDDVRTVGAHNLQCVDIIIGGYPCQSTSIAGKQKGLQDENKSGLWWHMHRIIGDLKPRIVIIENVANAIRVGGPEVVASLATLGYNCEWSIISGAQCGAPHLRKRWFCVAYTNPMPNRTGAITNAHGNGIRTSDTIQTGRAAINAHDIKRDVTNAHGIGWDNRSDIKRQNTDRLHIQRDTTQNQQQRGKRIVGPSPHDNVVTNAHGIGSQKNGIAIGLQSQYATTIGTGATQTYWQRTAAPKSTICGMDDGISRGLDPATRRLHKEQLKALGNAIIPQCSEWIGHRVLQSGLLDDLINQ
tara:strand:- start:2475 stop:3524 length:1050 start_codon:yes stop_codon:yes gene_type:complete